jgi:hypothetical protein
MKQPKGSLLDLWYMALSTPYGVEIACSPDFDAVRQALYRARTEARDDDLKGLALCQSPFDPSMLWIVKKEPIDATP